MKDKITISISGAAEIAHCGPSVIKQAQELGRECARAGVQISSGATSGFPFYVAEGFKEVGGFSIGLSPASNKSEHLNTYRLPLDFMDVIIYTGFGYPGRDLMLVRSSDAILLGCGRIGTIHEFTVAWESGIPIGILEGEWMTDEVIKNIVANSDRVNSNVIYDTDPKKLVEKVVAKVKEIGERKPSL
jgi:uncharacterized protein (TIGR00725 family)